MINLINHLHGRAAGDLVLCEIAGRIRDLAQAMGNVMLARTEGDSFACLLSYDSSSPASVSAPARLAAQIVQAGAAPIVSKGIHIQTGVSVGVSASPLSQGRPDEWLSQAHIAMLRAKRSGGSTFCSFESAMDAELKMRASLEAELRGAIAAGEIVPFYQPIVRLRDGALLGFEVLARWEHPSRGLLPPNLFIPIAEDAGLIDKLSFALLRRACTDSRQWPPNLTVSINISPVQLKNAWLAEQILQIVTAHGFAPGRLVVELTENGIIDDLQAACRMMTSLTNAGSQVALDDFGTGYSSLYHLRELNFNRIKIDQSFVKSINNPRDRKLVRAMIGLAHNLDMPVTAEGVEDDISLKVLEELGCDSVQGFLLGRPVPAFEVTNMINNICVEVIHSASAQMP